MPLTEDRFLITVADQGEVDAMRAALDFDRRFESFYEVNLRDYTFRFTWCCYAIAWGIARYDEVNAT